MTPAVAVTAPVDAARGRRFEAFPVAWRADVEPDPAEYSPGWSQSVVLVQADMAARHPELDARAAEALALYWGYCAQK